ncbi:hypothetical protein ACFS3C_02065 [Azotobacter vinelandii]
MLCAVAGIAHASGVSAEPADAGMTLLLEQADFWRSRHRPDLAREALNRALQVRPDAEEVLYRLGMLSLDDEKGRPRLAAAAGRQPSRQRAYRRTGSRPARQQAGQVRAGQDPAHGRPGRFGGRRAGLSQAVRRRSAAARSGAGVLPDPGGRRRALAGSPRGAGKSSTPGSRATRR